MLIARDSVMDMTMRSINNKKARHVAFNLLKRALVGGILFFFLLSCWANKVVELNVTGPIGPATADYFSRGIETAQAAALILILIDTPGGLEKSTRQMVQSILNSKVPVVAYVAPNGARAASAGAFLVYGSTLAAMAPGTHLGAASPVNLMNIGGQAQQKGTMDKKITNDMVAYIRSLAQLRGRDLSFAEKAVREAATLTAEEALQANVINLIAQDRKDLLAQLNEKTVVQNGQKIQLKTEKAKIVPIAPDWRTKFLSIVTDPTIAYLLLLLGIYGIFFELVNPGFMLPGVLGAIALLIALYALQLLPVNYAGLGLLILGLIFIIAEAFAPSFGVLGLGGTAAFILGSVMLINSDHHGYQIAWSAIGAMAAINVLFFSVLLVMTIKSKRRKVQHGVNTLLGVEGRTLGVIDREGQALIKGEIWSVYAKKTIAANAPIKVISARGLQLEIEEIQPKT